MSSKNLIETGKIVNTHGIKGEVKIQPWCDYPDILLDLDYFYLDNGEKLVVEYSKAHKGSILVKFKEISDINIAQKLKNEIIYIERDALSLDEGEYFVKDIIGISVYDSGSGIYYGKISDVMKTGANDIYEITSDDGVIRLVPAIKDVIISVDIDKSRMIIRPLEGLFE